MSPLRLNALVGEIRSGLATAQAFMFENTYFTWSAPALSWFLTETSSCIPHKHLWFIQWFGSYFRTWHHNPASFLSQTREYLLIPPLSLPHIQSQQHLLRIRQGFSIASEIMWKVLHDSQVVTRSSSVYHSLFQCLVCSKPVPSFHSLKICLVLNSFQALHISYSYYGVSSSSIHTFPFFRS